MGAFFKHFNKKAAFYFLFAVNKIIRRKIEKPYLKGF